MEKTLKRILTAGIAVVFAFMILPLTAMAAVKDDTNRLVVGTIINGVPVSGMTVEDAKAYIEGYFNGGYGLKIEDADGNLELIRDTDIGYYVRVTGDLNAILEQQNAGGRLSGPGTDNRFQVDAEIGYDEEKLKEVLENLYCVRNAVPTTDAHLSAYEEGQAFTIIPEVQGTEIDMEKLTAAVKAALNGRQTRLSLTDADCYKKVQVTSDDAELNELCANMNRYRDINITYVFGNQQEILPGTEVAKWITGADGTTVRVDQTKAAEYVKYLADKYDTYGKPHVFQSTSGREVSIEGDYGWQINQEEEIVALTRMVQNCSTQTREPAYLRTAASRSGNDFGTTYVEVDLGTQNLYLYENGVCIVSTPIVSGDVSEGNTTPPGLFTLNYKERDRILRGPKLADGTYSYESPVSYWMPFNGGIGLHDASWRSKFGGEIYKTNGSHGCINMPTQVAPTVYEHVYKGIPILCFY